MFKCNLVVRHNFGEISNASTSSLLASHIMAQSTLPHLHLIDTVYEYCSYCLVQVLNFYIRSTVLSQHSASCYWTIKYSNILIHHQWIIHLAINVTDQVCQNEIHVIITWFRPRHIVLTPQSIETVWANTDESSINLHAVSIIFTWLTCTGSWTLVYKDNIKYGSDEDLWHID